MLAKFPLEQLYHVFESFSVMLISKMSPLVLAADGKYPFQGCENFQLPIQMQLSEKRTF